MTTTTSQVEASATTTTAQQNAQPTKSFQPITPSAITIPAKRHICQKDHLRLNINSPNQNGTYSSDRIIKSGEILKRTRKTKSWKTVFIVLRPSNLSIYKDREYTKLRHSVPLYDLTAVARQRDPKHRVNHVFGVFSPSRNFHLSANSEQEAQSWAEAIRREARMDEEDEEMILMSPTATRERAAPFGVRDHGSTASSSEDADSATRSPHQYARRERGVTVDSQRMHSARRPSTTMQNYSGNEAGSFSDFSDPGFPGSVTSFTTPSTHAVSAPAAGESTSVPKRPAAKRNNSHMSLHGGGASSPSEDRVVCQGWVQLLKSHHGVHQWRSVWAVLRPKTFAIYKDDGEYSAQLVLPFSSLVDAVEIDPLSKTKRECFQLIAEERTYRLCAGSEADLDRWLGAFKSLLAKRKEGQIKAGGGVAAVAAVAALSLDAASANQSAGGEQVTASSSGHQSPQR